MEALRARMIRLFAEAGNALSFYNCAQKCVSQQPRTCSAEAEKAELEKIQALERTLSQRPDDLAARLELARLYLDRRDAPHAREQFKLVAQATEGNWLTDTDIAKAAEFAERLVESAFAVLVAWFALAWVLYLAGAMHSRTVKSNAMRGAEQRS